MEPTADYNHSGDPSGCPSSGMTPSAFLTALWGDQPPGMINIWRLPDRTSSWHRELGGIDSLLKEHANGELYTGVSLSDPQKGRFTTKNRIEEAAAGAIAGVWADIDVFHPVHTKAGRLPANREEAREVMAQLPYEPTLIVDSGHGLQYWWLLEKPWVFKDEGEWAEARRMVQWWHQMTLKLFEPKGWTADSVYDLSRILRIPGTFNNKVKDDPKEVVAIKTGGPRYTTQDFTKLVPEDFEATAPVPEQRRGKRNTSEQQQGSTTTSGLVLNPDAEPKPVRLNALLKADIKAMLTWKHQRPDLRDQSPSGYNMSLADIAVRAGWPDQEVVNLLICWRRIHGCDLKLRERYYELTLARAKEPIQTEREQRKLEETLADPPEGEGEIGNGVTDRPDDSGIDQTYDYRKANGDLLFQVVRYGPTPGGEPRFLQRRPGRVSSDPDTTWIWDTKGVRTIPYRLPELVAATSDVCVWIVEGEKDADRLHGHGLLATTNAGGPGKWYKGCTKAVMGRPVAIIPDNDIPGADHAFKVASALTGVAQSVRVLNLPGVGDGGDVSEWLDQGHTVDELRDLLAQTTTFEPPSPKDRSTEDGSGWANKSTLRPATLRITADMLGRGFFVNIDDDEFHYFDREQRQLVFIDDDEPEFMLLLAERYQINRKDNIFGYLHQHLRVEAHARGIQARARQFSYYDRDANVVFLDMGAGRVLKISADTIEIGDNGEDSVLFMPLSDHSPWQYRSPTTPGILHDTVVANVNFTEEDSVFTIRQQRLLLLLWMVSMAFESMMPTKILAVAVGPGGSGKTSLFRTCGQILIGAPFQVDSLQQLDKGEDDFWTNLGHTFFCCYDNVDQTIRWLPDALAQAATGVRRSKRQLHTSSKLHRREISCILALTARTPTGSLRRDDVADRSLLFHLDDLPAKRPEFDIQNEVARLRDDLMSDYATMVQKTLRVPLESVQVADPGVRMADFALVVTRIGAGLGPDVRALTDEAILRFQQAQQQFATEEDTLTTLLEIWLTESTPSRYGEFVPTRDLLRDLRAIAKAEDIKFVVTNATSLGRQMKNRKAALSRRFEVTQDRNGKEKGWIFRIRKDPAAEAQS